MVPLFIDRCPSQRHVKITRLVNVPVRGDCPCIPTTAPIQIPGHLQLTSWPWISHKRGNTSNWGVVTKKKEDEVNDLGLE